MRRFLDCSRREFVLIAVILIVLILSVHTTQLHQYLTRALDSDTLNESSLSLNNVQASVTQTVEGPPQLVPSYPSHTLLLGDPFPETTIVQHVPGWSIIDNLYLFNGTIFIVTSDPQLVPDKKLLTSSGYEIQNGPIERAKRAPTDDDIQAVTPEQALSIFKQNSATILDGVSFLVTDPRQFISHYYHWTAELLFGLWRTYASLDPFTRTDGHALLPPPKRLLFNHIQSRQWTDYAGLNQWVSRGAFPGMSIETSEDWDDRRKMQTVFAFERVVLADRAAASEGDPFKATWRTASNTFELPGNENWWLPIRRSVLEFSGVPERWIVGPDPGSGYDNYVITYISRQDWGRRMLKSEDHEVLVRELFDLRDKYGYEVNVVNMAKVPRAEQMLLAARTTIMMGVHGNGLTSLVWMRPTPRTTVMEFFIPGGFAFDYEWTARACGFRHYGFWASQYITQPNVPKVPDYPDGFQGNSIPIDGKLVANLVHERLTLPLSDLPTDNGNLLSYGRSL